MINVVARVAFAGIVMLAAASPSAAGCTCKDARTSWCAKNCYACFPKRAEPAGYCSYWLQKRKQRGVKDLHQ